MTRLKNLRLITLVAILFSCNIAHCLYVELGLSYSHKKTSFDADNTIDAESTTGSLSFYFFERFALEGSYTSALGVRREKLTVGTTVVTTQNVTQKTQVYGLDLIWILSDRKSFFQPFIKGGLAQINRAQEVQVDGLQTYTVTPENAVVPSYGLGFKLNLTDQLGLKFSYDAWQTPIGSGTTSMDASTRAGISWIF